MKQRMVYSFNQLLAFTSVVTLIAVLGCAAPASEPAPSPPAPEPTPPTITPTPTLRIIMPMDGATLEEESVQVRIEITDFNLTAPGGVDTPGEGHVHYYLDVDIPTAQGQAAVTAAGTYKATPETSVTWENLSPGTHNLGVQLVNNNHTPLVSPVTATVTITIKEAAVPTPTLKIIMPMDGATLEEESVQFIIEITDFNLTAPGGVDTPGEGHVHYYLDVDIPTAQGQAAVTATGTYKATPETSVTWENLSPGTHTLSVQLVNNNHTPLVSPVTATVTITIKEAAVPTPTLKIIMPMDGATLQEASVQVSIEISNFSLVPLGGENAPGEGHVHYYLDVDIPTAQGQAAVTAASTYKATPETSVTWENLSLGTHTLSVQLVNNNHTPLVSPVTATVTIEVTIQEDTGDAANGGTPPGY